MLTRRLFCALLISVNLYAAPELVVEQPAGTNLTAGTVIYFGGMQERYVDPTSQIHEGDGTYTVTFSGISKSIFSVYQIQRSQDGESNWQELFAPGLEPDVSGAIQFHDLDPQVVAFYRLLIFTDTERVFTIRNNGSSALTGIEVAVVGANAGFFELDATATDTTLLPGASTTFRVTYLASDTNSRTAELRITANIPTPFTVTLSSGDAPPAVNPPLLSNITITPAGPVAPAGIAGNITGGSANGSVFLEASSDFGQLDAWAVIAAIPLNASGNASFGTLDPITNPGSVGSLRNFYRLRIQ